MLIITKDTEKLITIVEGTGDNLTDEDIKDGYIDYVMTSIYGVDGEEVRWKDLSLDTQAHILEQIESGHWQGKIIEEGEDNE